MSEHDPQFEAFLRRAMTARPDLTAPADLALRAVARANAPRVASRAISRWRTLSSLAAAAIILVVLSVGAWRWAQTLGSTDGTSSVTDTSTVSAADVISSRNATMLLLGGAVFVIALGLVTLDRMMTSDDPMAGATLV